MEQFLDSAMYDLLERPGSDSEKATALKRFQVKIVKLHSINTKAILLDTSEYVKGWQEESTLHRIIRVRKRSVQRQNQLLTDKNVTRLIKSQEILREMTEHFRKKYSPIETNAESMDKILHYVTEKIPEAATRALEEPVTPEGLHSAQSPGPDGACNEFYKETWHYWC
jgi:hypothetical protein